MRVSRGLTQFSDQKSFSYEWMDRVLQLKISKLDFFQLSNYHTGKNIIFSIYFKKLKEKRFRTRCQLVSPFSSAFSKTQIVANPTATNYSGTIPLSTNNNPHNNNSILTSNTENQDSDSEKDNDTQTNSIFTPGVGSEKINSIPTNFLPSSVENNNISLLSSSSPKQQENFNSPGFSNMLNTIVIQDYVPANIESNSPTAAMATNMSDTANFVPSSSAQTAAPASGPTIINTCSIEFNELFLIQYVHHTKKPNILQIDLMVQKSKSHKGKKPKYRAIGACSLDLDQVLQCPIVDDGFLVLDEVKKKTTISNLNANVNKALQIGKTMNKLSYNSKKKKKKDLEKSEKDGSNKKKKKKIGRLQIEAKSFFLSPDELEKFAAQVKQKDSPMPNPTGPNNSFVLSNPNNNPNNILASPEQTNQSVSSSKQQSFQQQILQQNNPNRNSSKLNSSFRLENSPLSAIPIPIPTPPNAISVQNNIPPPNDEQNLSNIVLDSNVNNGFVVGSLGNNTSGMLNTNTASDVEDNNSNPNSDGEAKEVSRSLNNKKAKKFFAKFFGIRQNK